MSEEKGSTVPLDSSSEDEGGSGDIRCSILEEESQKDISERICPLSKRTILVILFSTLFSVLILIVLRSHLFDFLNWLQEAPLYETLIIFVVLFTVVAFPVAFGYIILNVAAGYIYGFCWGMLVVVLSVGLGFTVSFYTCRLCLKETISQQIKNSKMASAFVRIVDGKKGFKVILLARLTPIPFGIQNAVLAVTNISYLVSLTSTMIGSLPMQCLNAYMGSTLRDMAEVLTNRADGYIILAVQITIAAVLSLYVVRLAFKEFNKMADTNVENSSLGSNNVPTLPPV